MAWALWPAARRGGPGASAPARCGVTRTVICLTDLVGVDRHRDVLGGDDVLPSIDRITSPAWMPAASAGPPGTDARRPRRPWSRWPDRRSRRRATGGRPCRRARGPARPGGPSWTRSAKPMPTLPSEPSPPVSICELTPITWPSALSSGPPELPGLIAASVWIASSIWKPLGAWIARPRAGHDAGRLGAVEAERVADRDDRVTDAHECASRRAPAAWRAAGMPARRDAHDREVARRVDADDVAVEVGAVGAEADGDRLVLGDDVGVGDERAACRRSGSRCPSPRRCGSRRRRD